MYRILNTIFLSNMIITSVGWFTISVKLSSKLIRSSLWLYNLYNLLDLHDKLQFGA